MPVTIKVAGTQSPERFVKRIVVVIDKNPEPLAAVFHPHPRRGAGHIETEMRVETHSPVRAIVEMNDGKLVMAAKFVKAAGGCSVAPVLDADAAAAAAKLGQMQIRLPEASPATSRTGSSSSSTIRTTPGSRSIRSSTT